MASFNKVILMGHLTRDPQGGELPSGTPLCDFGLAVNRRWKDGQGQDREEVLFIDCTAFGKVGQTIATHLRKGRAVHIEGHLKLDQWEADDGTKRSRIKVVVEQFRFVDGKGTQAEGQGTGKADNTDASRVNGMPKGRGGRGRSNGEKSKRPSARNAANATGTLMQPAAAEGTPAAADIPF